MEKVSTSINGTEYQLATTLRVAYEVQGKHNHESYIKIFSAIADMTLEDQLDVLYVAFKIGNSEVAKTFTNVMFREYYLDNYTVQDVMSQLKDVVSGILGKKLGTTSEDDSEKN